MARRWWFAGFVGLAAFGSPAHGQFPDARLFSGVYGGVEVGPVSYNTQITFDGVDDPAGRGGLLYGAFLGYNRVGYPWLFGVEGRVTRASVPDPYTFDPAVTGFAELDIDRSSGVGLDARVGRLIAGRILIHGSVGTSVVTQTVHLDGVPLSGFVGGSEAKTFAAVQLGTGIEVALSPRLGFRFDFRSLEGHDLSADDFGTVVPDASLTFFDVEPGQHQFMFGLRYRF